MGGGGNFVNFLKINLISTNKMNTKELAYEAPAVSSIELLSNLAFLQTSIDESVFTIQSSAIHNL